MAVATSTMLAVAAGIGAVQSISGGIQAQKQAEANAEVYKQQAAIAEKQGEIEAFKAKQDIKRYENAAIAQSALNSSSLSGSYLENLNETYTNAELDMGAIEFNSALTQQNYLTQASSEISAGKAAFTQGLIGAGSSLIGGYNKINSTKAGA